MAEEFVEALVEAPVGVVTLAAIEERFGDRGAFIRPEDLVSDPGAVERAVDWVRGASVDEVLALAVEDGGGRTGPWVSGAAGEVAAAYRNAESRLPIAVAVAQRFDDVLHAPMDPAGQEWWVADRSPYRHRDGTLLWTVSSHPAEVHDGVVSARDSARDDLYPPPISRWSIEIESQPRVKEIHRPSDWVDLVERWPDPDADMYKTYGTWEFKSPKPPRRFPRRKRLEYARIPFVAVEPLRLRNLFRLHNLFPFLWRRQFGYDPEEQARELLAVPGQHAAYPAPERLVGVDWAAAAEHYDAVHLSWAGFLTAEGYVSEMADGSVTMLRGFACETTLWLSDVFAPVPAVPLGAPEGFADRSNDRGIDVAADGARAARDRLNLEVMLGRQEIPPPPTPDPAPPKKRRMWRR